MQLGETNAGFKEIRQIAKERFNLMGETFIDPDFRIVRNAFDQYIRTTDIEAEAIVTQNLQRAAFIRHSEADTAFDGLSKSLDDLNRRLDSESDNSRANSQDLKALTLLFAGVLLVALVMSLQRIRQSDWEKERDLHALEINTLRLSTLVKNSSDVVMLTSPTGVVTLVTNACGPAWGILPQVCIGMHITDIFYSIDSSELFQAFAHSQSNPKTDHEISLKVEIQPGDKRTFQLHIRNLLDQQHLQGMLLTFHDTTERAAVEEALTHQAFHDRLTGLANRSLVMARIGDALMSLNEGELEVAVLFIDSMLVQIAERVLSTVRPSDMVARLGGDEFVIVLDGPRVEDIAHTIAKRIVEQLSQPYLLAEQRVVTFTSIGIAFCKNGEDSPSELLKKARMAMYRAKNLSKASYAMFDSPSSAPVDEISDLEADLRSVVSRRGLEYQFLPTMTLSDQEVCEVELLLRWHHPTLGNIPPSQFIPMMESFGLMTTVDDWVLSEACRQLLSWTDSIAGLDNLKMCVNISGVQLARPDFVRRVALTLSNFNIPPSKILFDIAETNIVADLNASRKVCHSLRDLGVRTTIDNFGIGYGSMAYLKNMPVDGLKVDRTIIDQVGADVSADRIVRSIIETARKLSLIVTAEGIETKGQMQILKSYGFDRGQGNVFEMPMSATEMKRRLTQVAVRGGPRVF
jgi:PAS domain S-box-containing protein